MTAYTFAQATEKLVAVYTGLVFNIALIILLFVSGPGKDDKEVRHTRGFMNLCITIMLGSIITCATFYVRRMTVWMDFPKLALFMELLEYTFNMMLTYSFANYIEVVVMPEERPKSWKLFSMRTFNTFLMVLSLVSAFGVYFYKAPSAVGTDRASISVNEWYRLYIAFIIELYYLFYAVLRFVINSRHVNRRATITMISGIIVSITGILVEVLNPSYVVLNYPWVVLGLYVFYLGIENADYRMLSRTMKELVDAKKHAEEANRAKSDFAVKS